jgi:hypothetical protein
VPHFQKHFTRDEANALLPELRDILTAVQELRDRLVVERQGALPVLRKRSHNGGGPEANAFLASVHDLNQRLQRLVELGVQLKDIDKGLVDFPAWRGEREILLCWRLGEAEVAFWHELDSGYAGRKAL